MVAAGIILQDRDSNLYTVPEDYKQTIMSNMGFAPILFTLGKRSDKVKECFKKDGPYGNNRTSVLFIDVLLTI
jgi:hypothetical protein